MAGSDASRSLATVEKPANPSAFTTKSARSPAAVSRRTDAFADAPNVAASPTSASPITSADAVTAVRRGLRIAFARASTPLGPSARSGRPTAPATGRATVASNSTTPTSSTKAPIATTCTCSNTPVHRVGPSEAEHDHDDADAPWSRRRRSPGDACPR